MGGRMGMCLTEVFWGLGLGLGLGRLGWLVGWLRTCLLYFPASFTVCLPDLLVGVCFDLGGCQG